MNGTRGNIILNDTLDSTTNTTSESLMIPENISFSHKVLTVAEHLYGMVNQVLAAILLI